MLVFTFGEHQEMLVQAQLEDLQITPLIQSHTVLRLMVLEDSASAAQALLDPIKQLGYTVNALRIKNAVEFQTAIKKQEWDLIISPLELTSFNAHQALTLLNYAKQDIPFIIVCENIEPVACLRAVHDGVRAIVQKNATAQIQTMTQQELDDLSARRTKHQLERSYRETERRCQHLIASSSDPIALIHNGKLVEANPAFNDHFSQIIPAGSDKASIAAIIHRDDQQDLAKMFTQVSHGDQEPGSLQARVRSKDETYVKARIEAITAHVNNQKCIQISFRIEAVPPATQQNTQKIAAADVQPTVKTAELSLEPLELDFDLGPAPEPEKQTAAQADAPATTKPSPAADTIAAADISAPALTEAELETVKRIDAALADDRFHLVFQPIVNLHAEPMEAYDVLTRMIDEKGEELLPASFMPTAEKSGQMPAIDRWIIKHAMAALAQHQASSNETCFFIKLSPESINDRTLAQWMSQELKLHGIKGNTITVEIKEADALSHAADAASLIDELNRLGCRIALGNFGLDPKSPNNLEKFKVNYVKFPVSLINRLTSDPKAADELKQLILTAHEHNAQGIAAFVQEANKLTLLWQCGVDYIQGFFLQQPDSALSYNFSNDAT